MRPGVGVGGSVLESAVCGGGGHGELRRAIVLVLLQREVVAMVSGGHPSGQGGPSASASSRHAPRGCAGARGTGPSKTRVFHLKPGFCGRKSGLREPILRALCY
jgi:hypothetical protein